MEGPELTVVPLKLQDFGRLWNPTLDDLEEVGVHVLREQFCD